jgi:hypothetical protein
MSIFKILLLSTLCMFSMGCIEYRLRRPGLPDLYIGGPDYKRYLDPRLGPKGKLYLKTKGKVLPYLSGDFYRRKNLSPIVGLMIYPTRTCSIEIGYRRSIWENDWRVADERRGGINQWRAPRVLFYIGGKIVF